MDPGGIYVRGKNSAYKVMLMAASTFNLKKWAKQIVKESFDWFLSTADVTVLHMIQTIKFCNFKHVP